MLHRTLFLIIFLILRPSLAKYTLFDEETPFPLEISGDFDSIIKKAMWVKEKKNFLDNSCRPYHVVSLKHRYHNRDFHQVALARLRGWSRMTSKECEFFPLKIKFITDYDFPNPLKGEALNECLEAYKKNDLGKFNIPAPLPHSLDIEGENGAFHKAKTLKLVTRCNGHSKKRWVHRELAIYKLYELVTPFSLKTRPVLVSYKHRAEENYFMLEANSFEEHFAFFIENAKKLAKRLGLKEVEPYEEFGPNLIFPKNSINKTLFLRAQLFNYIIGNLDSDISLNGKLFSSKIKGEIHNFKILKNDQNEYFPVPYDFDWSSSIVRWEIPTPLEFLPPLCHSFELVQREANHIISLENKFLNKIDSLDFLEFHEKDFAKKIIKLSIQNLKKPKTLKKMYKKGLRKNNSCDDEFLIK